MATKKTPRSTAAKKATTKLPAAKPALKHVRVAFDPLPGTQVVYANHIEIGHTRHDFTLIVGRVPAKFSAEQQDHLNAGGEMLLEPELQLVIPSSLMEGLVSALTVQLTAWQASVKAIEVLQEAKNGSAKN
jgi:hypothetical protein